MRGVRTFGLRFESLALRDLEIERWRLCAAVNGTKGLMLGIVAKPEMAAQFTGWDLLGGFAWARMLSRRPELADRCDRAACAPRPPYQC